METLYKRLEQTYKNRYGFVEAVTVVDDMVTDWHIYEPTGADVRDLNGDTPQARYIGSSVDEIKAAGFEYAGQAVVYRDARGEQYTYDPESDSYLPLNPELPDLTASQVEVK